MRLSTRVGGSQGPEVEFKGNSLLGTVGIFLNGRMLYRSILLIGPDHATSGACPGEADVSEQMPSDNVHEWLVSVGENPSHRVVIRRKGATRFSRLRAHEYEIEVNGQVVERARGY